MDNVLVFGKDKAEHDDRVTAVLKRIESLPGVQLHYRNASAGGWTEYIKLLLLALRRLWYATVNVWQHFLTATV